MNKVYVNSIIFWKITPEDHSTCTGDKNDINFEIGTITAVDVDKNGNPLKGFCVVTSPTGMQNQVNYKVGIQTKTVKIIDHENIFSISHLTGFMRQMNEDRRRYMENHKI